MPLPAALDQAAQALSEARALAVLAGAGMGVDSGLPDFRGPEGLWRAYPPLAKLKLRFEDMANPAWFRRDPHFAWGFYGHRLQLYQRTTPHPGYGRLRDWCDDVFVFTSNVDGHFQRSGFDSHRVVEIHGSLNHTQCVIPCCDSIHSASGLRLIISDATLRAAEPLPRCPQCGQLARPNVLMFGDAQWIAERTEDQYGRWQRWLAQQRAAGMQGVVIVEIGAGSFVPTVRATSESLVEQGARLIRINPREPQVPAGQISLPMGGLAAIEALDARLGVSDRHQADA